VNVNMWNCLTSLRTILILVPNVKKGLNIHHSKNKT
jgi:hypothetical protein